VRVLIDTHILLWWLAGSDKLSTEARELIESADSALFSAASIWEIAIKARLGKMDFAVEPLEIAKAASLAGFREVAINSAAAGRVAKLPLHHRDPFDRLLIAQALELPCRLLTVDRALAQYSDLVIVV
jgi:PIN domain nuclease of toxin-antitoxin system